MKSILTRHLIAVAIVLLAASFVCASAATQNGTMKTAAATKPGTKTFTGEIWDSVNAQRGSRDQMMKEQGITSPVDCTLFAVRYLKPPAVYVLYDVGSKKIYELDHQEMAQPFAAMKVKVTGAYDEATKTIHVTTIEPAS